MGNKTENIQDVSQLESTKPAEAAPSNDKPGLYRRVDNSVKKFGQNNFVATTVIGGVAAHQVSERVASPLFDKAAGGIKKVTGKLTKGSASAMAGSIASESKQSLKAALGRSMTSGLAASAGGSKRGLAAVASAFKPRLK